MNEVSTVGTSIVEYEISVFVVGMVVGTSDVSVTEIVFVMVFRIVVDLTIVVGTVIVSVHQAVAVTVVPLAVVV